MKTSKKSLLASGVSLLASAVLLAGATFAWFTDSVTNTGNKIQSGKLAVTLEKFDPAAEEGNGGYVDAGSAPLFDYDKWEPGYTAVASVKIGNAGTLALKYQVDLVVKGEVSALADVIDVYYRKDAGAVSALPNSLDGLTRVGTLSEVLEKTGGAATGHLSMNGADFATIALHMQESAGNAYQELSIGAAFDIVVKATQYTEEEDGFGSDRYDKDAPLNFVPVGSEESFADALADVKSGDRIVLNQSISSEGKNLDFRGVADVEMDFAGHTVAVDNDNIALRVIGTADNRASAVFSDGAISAGAGTYCTIGASLAEVTLNNMTLNNVTPFGNSVKAFNGGVINLNNVQSRSEKGGAMVAAGGTINVNGGMFVQVEKYDWNSCLGAVSNNTGTLNVRDVTATGDNYGFYIFSSGGTINLYSGTFKAATVLKADLDLNSYPTAKGTINVYGGSFDGAIAINVNCTLNIEAGTFANTGLTLEQFSAYVAEGSTVTEADGIYTVTR